MSSISWETHTRNYFLEDDLEGYLKGNNSTLRDHSYLAALKIWYRFPGKEIEDTGNYIVLYRHGGSVFHPRINMQLKGPLVGKTNVWLDTNNFEIPAPYDNRKKFRLSTLMRWSYFEKQRGWFFKYAIPHLLAVMVEKDYDYIVTGTRIKSNVFLFDDDTKVSDNGITGIVAKDSKRVGSIDLNSIDEEVKLSKGGTQ